MSDLDVFHLDGRLLRTFMAVFKANSVTKGADALGMSQSAVSHHIDKLRHCLNDQLFIKLGRGIVPTDAAYQLAPKISRILSEMEGLTLQQEYDPVADQSTVTIATNVTELLPILIPFKKALRHFAPLVTIRFVDLGARQNVSDALAAQTADLAIVAALGPYSVDLLSEHLYEDEIVCFYDAECLSAPDTVEDYSRARHAALDFGGKAKSIVDRALERFKIHRNIDLYAANSFALSRMMIGEDLIATMPWRLKNTAFSAFDVAEPPFQISHVNYDIVWHRRTNDSHKHIWLRELFRDVASKPF